MHVRSQTIDLGRGRRPFSPTRQHITKDKSAADTQADWLHFGKRVVDMECEGLQALRDGLDAAFLNAIHRILACEGRVIVSGVGKSGHIGKKIAATFASTGTPSYFVHPAEASHGDLGLLNDGDILLAISNSGESRELTDILLFAKRHGLAIIAITKEAESTLGRVADVLLMLPQNPEACPLERAPTTSTATTLALGDAIAMTLMKIRDFREDDFANVHPGGKLGAMLLTVDHLLQLQVSHELPLVGEETSLGEIVLTITRGLRGHAGVTDKNGRLVGVISDGDLRRAYDSAVGERNASTIMSRDPKTVDATMRAYELRDLMTTHQISAVFVTDADSRPVGLVHLQELLKL